MSLDSIISRITGIAEIVHKSKSLYDRSKAISEDGSIPAKRLEGMIDVLKTRLSSSVSNWYTDDQGNLILESVNGKSAMQLCGEGFMIANAKTDDGKWDWRTFGTGEGFTADLIIAGFLSADRIQAGTITANKLASDVGQSLDLSSNTSIRGTISQTVDEAISEIEVGGANLIENSASYLFAAGSDDTFWVAADELKPGITYTLSVHEVILVSGSAAGVTWTVANQDDGAVHTSGTLEFTYGKQVRHFTVPATTGNWTLRLYDGIRGSTSGVSVQLNKVKLEEGTLATAWSPAAEDGENAITRLNDALQHLDSGMDDRVRALIDSLGLSDQYASTEEFLAALGEIELIRSELAQQDSQLTLTFNRLTQAEGSIEKMFSSFVFGDENGTPYLDMSASSSSMKMRLTNTRLAFVQSGTEVAYFSDNKLYVTRLEAVEQISIGTAANGYLDIVTTPSGVGLKWRT